MPETIRALVVILVLQGVTFALMRKPVVAIGMAPADYDRRRNCWLALTALVFISPSFWIAMASVAIVAIVGRSKERNPVALYTMLLLAMPLIGKDLPGIGPIEHLLNVNHSRILALVLLLPAAIGLATSRHSIPFGKVGSDKTLIGYFSLLMVLYALVSTPLGAIRAGFVYPMLDALMLYFVASRSLDTKEKIADLRAAFVVASALLASIAVFEFGKHWLLYSALPSSLGAQWGMGNYLLRNDAFLRAIATTGQPIALGYVMMIGIGMFLPSIATLSRSHRSIVGVFLAAGLIAAMSRGPWIGTASMLLIFIAIGRRGGRSVLAAAALVAVIGSAMYATSAGRAILAYLPFVGDVEAGGVSYRQQVFEVSMQVMRDRPFFGVYDYVNDTRMEALRQGEGIIDIVNTYVGIALASGFVGLTMFVATFALCIGRLAGIGLIRSTSLSKLHLEHARTVIAVLVGVLVTIGTTSSVTIIGHVYWIVLGSGVALVLSTYSTRRSRVGDTPASFRSRPKAIA